MAPDSLRRNRMQDTEEPTFAPPALIEEGTYADAWESRRSKFFGLPYDREEVNTLRAFVAWKRYNLRLMEWHERKRQRDCVGSGSLP